MRNFPFLKHKQKKAGTKVAKQASSPKAVPKQETSEMASE